MFFIIFRSFHNTPSICQQDKSVKTLFSDQKYFPSYFLFSMKRNFLTLSVINKRPFNRDIRDSICDEYAIRIMVGNMRPGKGKSNIMLRGIEIAEQSTSYFILQPSFFQRKFLFLFLLGYFLCLICKFEPCLMFCLSFKSNFGKIISTNLCANQFKFLSLFVCFVTMKGGTRAGGTSNIYGFINSYPT